MGSVIERIRRTWLRVISKQRSRVGQFDPAILLASRSYLAKKVGECKLLTFREFERYSVSVVVGLQHTAYKDEHAWTRVDDGW